MSVNEEEALKSFFKNIDFEKIDKNAKRKSKLSILITLPINLFSIFFLVINWNNNELFLSNIYNILFWFPTWITLFCSILSYRFKNGLALERLSIAPKPLFYIVITLPMYVIIHSSVFSISKDDQSLIFTIFGLTTAIISLATLVVLLTKAIRYEKKAISSKEELISTWKKYGMSEQEIKTLLND